MRLTFILFLIIFTFQVKGQKLNEQQIIEVFDNINKSDASNLKNPEIRNKIFITNFDTIIWIIKNQGFPVLSEEKHKKKSIENIERGARRTFIHILQNQPKLLLNLEIIELLRVEIVAKRLNNKILKLALSIFQFEKDVKREDSPIWTEEIENNFYLAIRVWDIKLYPVK